MTCAVVLPSTAPLYVDMDVTTKGIEEPVAAEPQDGSYSLSLLLLSCSTEPMFYWSFKSEVFARS